MLRSSSRMAPRIRVAAYRAKGTPRSASKPWAAWTRAVRPAEVRSSRFTWAGTRTIVSRTTWPTRAMWLSISSSLVGFCFAGHGRIVNRDIPCLG